MALNPKSKMSPRKGTAPTRASIPRFTSMLNRTAGGAHSESCEDGKAGHGCACDVSRAGDQSNQRVQAESELRPRYGYGIIENLHEARSARIGLSLEIAVFIPAPNPYEPAESAISLSGLKNVASCSAGKRYGLGLRVASSFLRASCSSRKYLGLSKPPNLLRFPPPSLSFPPMGRQLIIRSRIS